MAADVTLEEACDQIVTRIRLADALFPEEAGRGITPARVVVAMWDIMRARARNGMPVYSPELVRGVVWTLAPWRGR